jgi:hypothetical protein
MEQPKQEKSKVLYDAVSKDYDLGTYDEFNAKLQSPDKRKAFYEGVGKDYSLGTFEEFESKVSTQKKKETSNWGADSLPKSTASSLVSGEFPKGKSKTDSEDRKPQPTEEELRSELSRIKVTAENMDEVMAKTDALSSFVKSKQAVKDKVNSDRVKELDKGFYSATRRDTDDLEVEQRLQDRISGSGFMNTVSSVAKSSFNTVVGGVSRLTDSPEINNLQVN